MKYFIVGFLLLLSTIGWSQEVKFLFRGKVQNIDLGKKEGGVSVAIVQSGRTVSTVQTASSGKYTLRGGLKAKSPFEVVFSKAGLVSKRVKFDFSAMNDEDTPASAEFEPVESLDIDLFKDRPGLDFSFLDTEPVASFDWSSKKLAPQLDTGAASRMRRKIDDILNQAEKDKAAAEAAYQAAIRDGQAFYDEQKYEEALSRYEEAAGIKPNEQLPADRIVELDALIKAQKEAVLSQAQADSEYNNLITAADNLRDKGELKAAVSKYTEAISKKAEQYPKDQVELLNAQIAAAEKEKENQAAYDAAIISADKFMKQNSLRAAKDKYTVASNLKPSEQYPKDKLQEIADKMGALEEKEALKKKYNEAIAAADALYSAEDFKDAKEKYQEALTYEKSATYPKERIKMCDTALVESEAAEAFAQKIADLIKKGNDEITANDLENAKASFMEVLDLDAVNAIAPPKLEEIEMLIQEANDVAAQEKKYNDLIASGDANDDANKLEDALADYTEAKGVKSAPKVQAKIDAVQAKIDAAAALADKQASYDKLIADAGQKMSSNDLTGAKTDYEAASAIDPTQVLPKEKIAEIDALLATKAADAEMKANYETAMAEAQQLLTAGDLDNAKAKYFEAGTIDPSQSEPKEKIAEIDQAIQTNMAAAELDENYNNLITEAEGREYSNDLTGAIASYQKASNLKPSEILPKDKIRELQELVSSNEIQAKLDADYNALLHAAASKESVNDLSGAISEYQKASNLKPSESLPKEKIAELQGLIANNANQAQLDADYNKLISEAGTLEASGNVDGAIAKYQAALRVKPTEQLPKDRIAELQSQIANQREIDRQYKEAMDRGDQLMTDENYLDAITAFNEALAFKPSEQEPVEKAALAEELERKRGGVDAQYEKILSVAQKKIDAGDLNKAEELAGRAKGLKPEDPRPDALLTQIARVRAIQADYDKNMSLGESSATAGKYQEAIEYFNIAKTAKPTETLPEERITEMNRLLGDQNSAAQKEKLYQDNMAKGQATQGASRFEEALGHYQNALAVKPGDQPATDKINQIQQLLDDIANANSDEIAKKNKFDALIKGADQFFSDGKYVGDGTSFVAKETYELALGIYPTNSYAITRRDECVKRARQQANAEGEAAYANLLKVADRKLKELDYPKAKELYTRAVGIRNADPYPKAKLAEIEAILNPPLAESVELEDLGIPFDATQIDGNFVLGQDEQKRKSIKKTRLERKVARAYRKEVEMTAVKTTDRLDAQNEIAHVLSLIVDNGLDSDDGRLELIEELRLADEERDVLERGNQQFETAENLSTQGTLDLIAEEVTLQKQEDDRGHMVNTDKVNAIQTAQTIEQASLGAQYVDVSYEQDERITGYVTAAIEETKSDYDDRLEIERKVDGAVDVAYDVNYILADGRADVARTQQDGIDGVYEAKRTKNVEAAAVAGDNNEELKVVQGQVSTTADNFQTENRAHGYQTDAEIAEVNRLVIADNTGFDKVRKEANERLKDVTEDRREMDRIAYNSEMEKYLANQATINTEIEKKKDIQELSDASMAQKIEDAEINKERARLAASQGEMNDLAARQNVSQSVDLLELSIEEKDLVGAAKTKENSAVLADVNKTKVEQTALDAQVQQDKAYANAEAIGDVDNTPQEKPVIKNALGKEYPEGVSQESFKQTDNEGLVKSIITRRIVVVEGHANVYVRTQTTNGITYSKNNRPSLANVWNSETQGPDLVRHY